MKTAKIYLVFFLSFISCNKDNFIKEFYSNGILKLKIQINEDNIPNGIYEEYYDSGEIKIIGHYLNGKIVDSVFHYYKNKKIKEKGLFKNNLKNGWWTNYDSLGFLKNKSEYIIVNNEVHKNQTIDFDKKRDTIFKTSSFFNLYIPDTIKLGKNIGHIRYNSNFKTKDKYIYFLIDNQISDREIIKDTFIEEPNKSRIGIYAYKKGIKIVRGTILETVLESKIINKNSAKMISKEYKKYFKKVVYVKE